MMTRVIVCTSGKGGVGKTTLVSNLSSALSSLGKKVVAIDANITTPNLGLHLGLHLAPNNLNNVLKGDTDLNSAIYPHKSGFKVVPSSMSTEDLYGVDVSKLPNVLNKIPSDTDFVIMDSAPGLSREAISAMSASNEVLIITNPDIPSLVDALKTIQIAESMGKNITGVVVNRVRGIDELATYQIENILEKPVIAEIPEDRSVSKSIKAKEPMVNINPNSPASIEINRLAHYISGIPFKYKKPPIFKRFLKWLSG